MDNTTPNGKAASLNNPISRLALSVAKIMLRFNVEVFEFIEWLKYHLVMESKRQEPEYTIVQISARTQLDRRQVSKILNNEQIKQKRSRITLILQEIRRLCLSKNTTTITKLQFDAVCRQFSSGALTTAAIAQELLRLGYIAKSGKSYRVIKVTKTNSDDDLGVYYMTRRFVNELHAYCLKHNTDFIPKHGKHSLISIYDFNNFKVLSLDDIVKYLLNSGDIVDKGDGYKLNDWQYNSRNDVGQLVLVVREVNRLVHTVLHNIDKRDVSQKILQRTLYSNQINPKKFSAINDELKAFFVDAKQQIFEILLSYEEDVPRGSYPAFGFSVFSFEDKV